MKRLFFFVLAVAICFASCSKENSSLEAEINIKIDNKRQEYSKLQSDLNNIKTIKDTYDRQYDKLQDELRTLQMGYNAFDIELGKLANKKNNYLDRLARYDADIVEYRLKIEENTNKVKDLEASNSELGNKKLLSDLAYNAYKAAKTDAAVQIANEIKKW